jgi:hypothetical protein
MAAFIFIAGLIWGSLSAQFLVQTITSLIIALVYLAALASAKVPRAMNVAGCGVSLLQAIIFAALFLGGNWLAGFYIDFASMNAPSIASLVSFLATLLYTARQMPGKILLAKLSAGDRWFLQAAMNRPREERLELAWKYRASPTPATLYPPSPSRAVPPIENESPYVSSEEDQKRN